jgi:hypothetical protein
MPKNAEGIMDFLVIKVAQQLDVDFMFEPTIWLEPVSYPTDRIFRPVEQSTEWGPTPRAIERLHDQR